MRSIARLSLCAVLILIPLWIGTEPVLAGGRMLDGRPAPDMTFTEGLFGLERGATLSSFRGQPVFIKFWLRDCPHCRKTLPEVQEFHDRWGKAGLQVLTVVHGFGPAEVAPVMQQLGYDFPVVCDLDGSQAKKYDIGSRPADYLVGVDGRVKSSNGVTPELLSEELGRYRLAKLGEVPTSLKDVRDAVWQGRMGTALRQAEEAARAAGAGADVKGLAERVRAIAEETLQARAHWADIEARRGHVTAAADEFAAIKSAFEGTSLEAESARLAADFRRRVGG